MTDPERRRGAVVVRVRPFESPGEEVARAMHPPWPVWMRRLYELEAIGLRTPHPRDEQPATIGAAMSALAERLRHRLGLVAFVVTAMEELGWEASMDGDEVLISKVIRPELAAEELERAGIYGPMSKVCDLDEHGMPVLHTRWEARR
jgi:hypothetical protein